MFLIKIKFEYIIMMKIGVWICMKKISENNKNNTKKYTYNIYYSWGNILYQLSTKEKNAKR